jgi:hypothetical protein
MGSEVYFEKWRGAPPPRLEPQALMPPAPIGATIS